MAWTETDKLRHSLVPLNLAVDLVRTRLRELRPGYANNRDSVAMFIGATISVYEYFDNSQDVPRSLRNLCRKGLFREGGRELYSLDGSPSIANIAIHADDVQCVVEMLAYPERANLTRSKSLIAASRRLIRRNRVLLDRTRWLCGVPRTPDV